jgi:hypothetical protein
MFSTGRKRVPIDKALPLARALETPLLPHLWLVLAQYGRDSAQLGASADRFARHAGDERVPIDKLLPLAEALGAPVLPIFQLKGKGSLVNSSLLLSLVRSVSRHRSGSL